MDDVAYFSISEQTTTTQTLNSSLSRTETTVRTDTKRTATLYFAPACGRPPLQFSGDDVNALEAMMPEKRK